MTHEHSRSGLMDSLAVLWTTFCAGAAAFFFLRLALLLTYGTHEEASHDIGDVVRAFWMGFRFDAKTMATALLPALIAACILYPLSRRRGRPARVGPVIAWSIVALFALDSIAMVNHYFFKFYQSPINALFFGITEDDTIAIFKSIRAEMPVIKALAILVVTIGCQAGLVFAILALRRRSPPPRTRSIVAAAVATAMAMAFFARGSLGTFPLRRMHLSVADNVFVNQLVPNGAQALYFAWLERKDNRIGSTNPEERLRKLGFRSPAEAATVLGLEAETDEDVYRALYSATPENAFLKAHPPHVILFIMESWGSYVLQYHSNDNNILGRLADHFSQDIVFTNFVSGRNGSHPSLEILLVNTPISPLTQGAQGYRSYQSAAALPFKAAGYSTTFLTSTFGSWRDVGRAMRLQSFDRVLDMADIQRRYPDAQAMTWGVHDQYTFDLALELLKEADERGQPLFLVVVSGSAHAPYQVPDGYKPYPLAWEGTGMKVDCAKPLADSVLLTHQYANDMLGRFLSAVKESPLGKRTIVAATGDHSARTLLDYDIPEGLLQAQGVPFYLCVPADYRSGAVFDSSRWGSHRDIFPTLYTRALSGVRYLASGADLLSPAPAETPTALGNGKYLYCSDGVVAEIEKPTYLFWDESTQRLRAGVEPTPELVRLARRALAQEALMDWQIRMQVLGRAPDLFRAAAE